MDTQEIPSDISEDGPLSPFLSHNDKNRRQEKTPQDINCGREAVPTRTLDTPTHREPRARNTSFKKERMNINPETRTETTKNISRIRQASSRGNNLQVH